MLYDQVFEIGHEISRLNGLKVEAIESENFDEAMSIKVASIYILLKPI